MGENLNLHLSTNPRHFLVDSYAACVWGKSVSMSSSNKNLRLLKNWARQEETNIKKKVRISLDFLPYAFTHSFLCLHLDLVSLPVIGIRGIYAKLTPANWINTALSTTNPTMNLPEEKMLISQQTVLICIVWEMRWKSTIEMDQMYSLIENRKMNAHVC